MVLEKPAPKADEPVVGRFVVQIGAFSDAVRAQDVRIKVERMGIKTYVQEVKTQEGKRIRVRVGPFRVRSDAEKMSQKIKKMDISATVLRL